MADLSITAANVQKSSTSQVQSGKAGETITAGQSVYLKASDTSIYKADNNVDAATAAAVGVSLNGAAAGQPINYTTSGPYTAGGTLVVGETYIVSSTAGGIAPIADISTNYVTILGVAISASLLQLNINVSGIQHA